MQIDILNTMLLFLKNIYLFYLFTACFVFISCKQNQTKLTEADKIVTAYANEFLNEDNEYIYFKSKEDIKQIKDFLGYPLTVKKITDVTKPVDEISLDSLITRDMLKDWDRKLNNYSPILWNQQELSGIPFITDNEIPDFYNKGGIPKKDERIVTIHFLSTPIISNNVALLYYNVKKSPMNQFSGYFIYAKINNKWKIVAKDVVVWGG